MKTNSDTIINWSAKILLCMFVSLVGTMFIVSYERGRQNDLEKKEQDIKSIKYFNENRELIFTRINNYLNEHNDNKAIILLDQYVPTNDELILKMRNDTRERILLSRLEMLSKENKKTEEKLKIKEKTYLELNKLKPNNTTYYGLYLSASKDRIAYESKNRSSIIHIL